VKLRFHITKETWVLTGILLLFAVTYCLQVFPNHYNFRTYNHDLTYYSHSIYQFSKLRLGEYILTNETYWHTFGDHFEPILMLIAPLRYIFGTVTLLVLQIAAILFGALGLYRYVRHRSSGTWLPHLAAFYFCSFWGIYGALGFDFHAAVLGAMMVPWLVDAFERRQWKQAVVWLLLFVMCGEKVAFWAVFIGLGMALLHRKDRQLRWAALIGMAFSLVWFFVALKLVIPDFQNPGGTYRHFRLHQFGENLGDALLNMLQRPVFAFKSLFLNHQPDNPYADHLKGETWKMIFLSGGLILLWRPWYLLMLIPVFAGKMFNDYSIYWSINAHYSIEFVPIISLALFSWLVRLKKPPWQYGLAIFVAALTLTSTLVSFSTRYSENYIRENVDIFAGIHWKNDLYDPAQIHEAIKLIPPDAAVSASDRITPHLSMRDKIYRFPKIEDADYIVISHRADTYPIDIHETLALEKKLIEEWGWEVLLTNEAASVLRRPPP
jgi:uncharacterized membrane protein